MCASVMFDVTNGGWLIPTIIKWYISANEYVVKHKTVISPLPMHCSSFIWNKNIYIYPFYLTSQCCDDRGKVKWYMMKQKDLLILHNQYHDWCQSHEARNQGISSQVINLVQIVHTGFSPKRVYIFLAFLCWASKSTGSIWYICIY